MKITPDKTLPCLSSLRVPRDEIRASYVTTLRLAAVVQCPNARDIRSVPQVVLSAASPLRRIRRRRRALRITARSRISSGYLVALCRRYIYADRLSCYGQDFAPEFCVVHVPTVWYKRFSPDEITVRGRFVVIHGRLGRLRIPLPRARFNTRARTGTRSPVVRLYAPDEYNITSFRSGVV
jgi:hypothetical protein